MGIRETLNMSKTILIQRKYDGLEFLISRWSIESHTFVSTWEEFGPTPEDVLALTCLPMFGEQTPS